MRLTSANASSASTFTQLGHEIRQSQTLAELGELRPLALRFAAQSLTEPSTLVWVTEAFTELNRLIVSRAIELTEGAADGPRGTNWCWVFLGAAARGELVTGAMPDIGLVYEDGDGEVARRLGEQVSGALRQRGYHSPDDAITPSNERACRSLAEWKDSYSRWISDPVLSGIYAALLFFELTPVRGDAALATALQQHIQEEVKKDESFVPILANDSMANLPPITFFQGLVVEDDGERTSRFDLRRSTLRPLADVGRVFALERAETSQTPTVVRLEATGALEFSSAGHQAPYLLRPPAQCGELETDPGIVLGILEQAKYQTQSARLVGGDKLFLFTDGVTEAM